MESGDDSGGHGEVTFGKEFWRHLMDLFEDDLDEQVMSIEFWAYNVLRLVALFLIIPAWIIIGLVAAGWLWPPQIRENIYTSTVSKHSSEIERQDYLRKTQVASLQKEAKELQEDMNKELKIDRTHIVQMKSAIAERRLEIANEMKQIKRLMTMLFEQQSGFDT
jgi:hypothetical protein